MLVTDHLPKLGPDLVTALASLNVQDFPHFFLEKSELQKLLLFVAVAMNELDESICRGRREGESGDRTVELIIIEREMAGHFCFVREMESHVTREPSDREGGGGAR